MSNSYGFDFLKNEHLDEVAQEEHGANGNDDHVAIVSSSPSQVLDAAHKPDLEKQYDILAFLQAHRGSGCLAPSVIYKNTGIDLTEDVAVAAMLQRNQKVRTEFIPDPENPELRLATYAYQAKYANVRDRTTLLAQINRMTAGGVPMRDLLDSYQSVEEDLQALITAGDILALSNNEDKDKILYPRGEAFLVELDGLVSLPKQATSTGSSSSNGVHHAGPNGLHANGNGHSSITGWNGGTKSTAPIYTVETDIDPRDQIRRGEAIQVGGQWFRVSSAVREGPLSDQPARAQAPLSVVSMVDLSKKNDADGYIRPLDKRTLPLDAALSETAQRNVTASKTARERLLKLAHGRSGGVAGQLLGNHAHASNPTTLAASFAAGSANMMHMRNKRPNVKVSSTTTSATVDAQHASQDVQVSRDDLEKAAADPALALYSHARRHGCTKDVRDMYLATRTEIPESDHDLKMLLREHKLLDANEEMRRPRLTRGGTNVDNDGKPKKRRYYERKNQRMTNTHLEGTEIGAVLARAAEKQKQGQSVGDGGM